MLMYILNNYFDAWQFLLLIKYPLCYMVYQRRTSYFCPKELRRDYTNTDRQYRYTVK